MEVIKMVCKNCGRESSISIELYNILRDPLTWFCSTTCYGEYMYDQD